VNAARFVEEMEKRPWTSWGESEREDYYQAQKDRGARRAGDYYSLDGKEYFSEGSTTKDFSTWRQGGDVAGLPAKSLDELIARSEQQADPERQLPDFYQRDVPQGIRELIAKDPSRAQEYGIDNYFENQWFPKDIADERKNFRATHYWDGPGGYKPTPGEIAQQLARAAGAKEALSHYASANATSQSPFYGWQQPVSRHHADAARAAEGRAAVIAQANAPVTPPARTPGQAQPVQPQSQGGQYGTPTATVTPVGWQRLHSSGAAGYGSTPQQQALSSGAAGSGSTPTIPPHLRSYYDAIGSYNAAYGPQPAATQQPAVTPPGWMRLH
jgi:hypothetical protein